MGALVAPALMFVIGAALVGSVYVMLTWLPGALARRRIDRRLADVALPAESPGAVVDAMLVKRRINGVVPALDSALATTGFGVWLARLIEQAGIKVGASSILVIAAAAASVGALLSVAFLGLKVGLLPGALTGGVAPFVVLLRKRSARMHRFEEQFPEALDLLSRAIRAGHAFTTAMGMVADEAPAPIGPEFRKTFEEQNFGLPLKDALGNLGDRVPHMDVRFFVTAVLIQRETGGNLSEILDNLSHVVRERFKILRQVRVYTAHGRLTGYVLMALPAALAIVLSFINPDHVNLLFSERMGQIMILTAIVMQTVGYLWIRKVVTIEV
jgi:tight adherence protein B